MIKNAKKIVIKVGTSTLTYGSGMLNLRKIEELCKVICDLQNSGKNIILVSSGAVSAGRAKLGIGSAKLSVEEKQAAAAAGQCQLMNMYERNMSVYGHEVAQILLTKDAVENPERRQHAENTFRILLGYGCIPVVNENDSVSYEEIKFGGNDTLSAYVARLCYADLLINLTDVDGLYDSDPRKNPDAKLIRRVADIDKEISSFASGAGTERGTGGMSAKLRAAADVMEHGIPMIIANGANPDVLYSIIEGEEVGTLFAPADYE